MPRGRTAKVNRAHNKAMLKGNSCKGASGTTSHQSGGKKYSKGDAQGYGDGCITAVVYNSIVYNIQYKFMGEQIYIISMISNSDKCNNNAVDIQQNMDKCKCKELQYAIIRENLTKLTNHALKYDKITIANYIKMVQEGYIIRDDTILKNKLTKMIFK